MRNCCCQTPEPTMRCCRHRRGNCHHSSLHWSWSRRFEASRCRRCSRRRSAICPDRRSWRDPNAMVPRTMTMGWASGTIPSIGCRRRIRRPNRHRNCWNCSSCSSRKNHSKQRCRRRRRRAGRRCLLIHRSKGAVPPRQAARPRSPHPMQERRCQETSDESYRLRDAVDGSLSLGPSNRSATPTGPEFP